MCKKALSMLVWATLAPMLLPILHNAEASCGSANCFLVTGTQEGIALPNQIILDLSYRWIPQDEIHEGSDQTSDDALVPRIDFENGMIVPDAHREIRTNNELVQLDVSYGLSERMAMTLVIPFLNNRTHEHDHVPSDFSRDDGTSGFGDVRLLGKYALWVSTNHLFVSGLGVKIPTGEYKLLDHEGEINEPTIQPGTGSWDGMASAYYTYQILPHRLDTFLSGSYQVTTENDLDYRMGNTLLINMGLNYLFADLIEGKPLTTSLQLNSRSATRDEFNGEEVPSTGGRWIYITPGLRIQAAANTAVYTYLQVPVYQYVNDINLVPQYGMILGISQSF